MRRFAVFSGFLGSGKTTTMMALTDYVTANYGKAAMISNDLGGAGLADNRLAQLQGCNASELTGDCICYQTDNLVTRLDSLYAGGCVLVISDIPGFGVGALEHVYHTLQERCPDRYALAPFTVLVEPDTVRKLQNESGGDLAYILTTQLAEADLIVLNKRDLLTEEACGEMTAFLQENWPQAQVLAISARTGAGLEELSQALLWKPASMHRPDIGYGGAAFAAAMGKISEYYLQYHAVVCCNDFDGTAYLQDLAGAVQTALAETGGEIPHLKLLAWEPEGDYGKVDLLGTNRPLETPRSFTKPCTELAVILNGSAASPAQTLDAVVTGAVETVSARYQLTVTLFKKECFGMGG